MTRPSMLYYFSSCIIKDLLLPGIDKVLRELDPRGSGALSPVMEMDPAVKGTALLSLQLSEGERRYRIRIIQQGFSEREISRLVEQVLSMPEVVARSLSLLFRRRFLYRVQPAGEEIGASEEGDTLQIDIAVRRPGADASLTVQFPRDLIHYFSPAASGGERTENPEEAVISFFQDPFNLFPRLRDLLEVLPDSELQKIFSLLQRGHDLTPYQIGLMVTAFPDSALKIKRNLSSNSLRDAVEMMRLMRSEMRITERDLAGGVYSLEEAVFFLLRDHEGADYSQFLRESGRALREVYVRERVASKPFPRWIEEMEEGKLLYPALSVSDERDITAAVSDDPDWYLERFRSHLSARRLEDIRREAAAGEISSSRRMEARSSIVEHYIGVKISRMSLGGESFEFLLRRMTGQRCFSLLLLSAGWFALSTAMKGMKLVRIKPLLSEIPRAPSCLIEDVLNGTVNPGILHDEIQIQKARTLCVRAILTLWEEGKIGLVE